jgi:hypothetical protein
MKWNGVGTGHRKIEEKAFCHDGEFMTEESLLTFFLEMAICA